MTNCYFVIFYYHYSKACKYEIRCGKWAGTWTVDSGQWAVDSEQMDSVQWKVGEEQ